MDFCWEYVFPVKQQKMQKHKSLTRWTRWVRLFLLQDCLFTAQQTNVNHTPNTSLVNSSSSSLKAACTSKIKQPQNNSLSPISVLHRSGLATHFPPLILKPLRPISFCKKRPILQVRQQNPRAFFRRYCRSFSTELNSTSEQQDSVLVKSYNMFFYFTFFFFFRSMLHSTTILHVKNVEFQNHLNTCSVSLTWTFAYYTWYKRKQP